MKYQLKVYYRTSLMDKITKEMQELIPEWKRRNTQLEGCKVFEFETTEPLSVETIEKLKVLKEDWMNEIVVEALI